jgi:asparagine synthase (glutamine-hydrolysing)
LIAGQFVVFEKDKVVKKHYYQYQPWRTIEKDNYKELLSELTLNILRKMIKSLNGRQVVIPLSAGNDSRLIASGLKHLGYENVKCYSYGIKGNFEAKIAKIIANKLGYEYKFIPLTIKSERKFYKSDKFNKYLEFSDSCVAVPYFQSLSTIPKLTNWIDKDAIFINGNSGDFISGAHIRPSIQKDNSTLSRQDRLAIIFKETTNKHFSLWGYLKINENLDSIRRQLLAEMPVSMTTADKDHGLYEYSELINRQSKYVISGQRSYEFYGFEWRLPLWDDEYLNFWQKVPLKLKSNQELYADMLKSENWAGVWSEDIPVNKKTIRPLWIVPLRFLAKALFLFSERNKWHQFEINIFYYFMDVTRMMSTIGYIRVVKDIFKKPKNHVSWQVEDYLKIKNGSQ